MKNKITFFTQFIIAVIIYIILTFLITNFLKFEVINEDAIRRCMFLTSLKDAFILVATFIFIKKYFYARYLYIDFKTQTFNNHKLTADLSKHCNKNKEFLLCFIDITTFKQINDIYGHDIGDQILIEICKRLKSITYVNIYRYGGDEFVIIINNDFQTTLQKIYDINNIPIKILSQNKLLELNVKFSIGTCSYPIDATNPEKLIKLADSRMYKDKKSAQ